jgi:membrane fusion protein (multidrug efflux system)
MEVLRESVPADSALSEKQGDPKSKPLEPAPAPPQDPPKSLITRAQELLHNRRFMRIAIPVAVVLALAIAYGIYNLIVFESTDDAYITADLHIISPHINGRVIKLLVNDNQIVKKDDILVQLDPRDYQVQLKIAQASLIKAQNDMFRWSRVSVMKLEPADKLLYDADQAALLTAQANLENAQLQMEYTNVIAPEDGKIGARTVTTGEQLQAGQELMALVEMRPWVVANYKENQLKKIRVGQKAIIKVR